VTAPYALEAEGVRVEYATSGIALDGVDIRVPRGAIVALLGANGAGKTTFVRSVFGLLHLHNGRLRAGRIAVDGAVVSGRPAKHVVSHGVSIVPEGRMLFPRLTVVENLRCGVPPRTPRQEVERRMAAMWELFPKIEARRTSAAGLLSGGEQQMVAVARALMRDPKVLVCDELSLGLAPGFVLELFDAVRRINAEQGTSVLLVEQNAELALEASTYGYVLESGTVVSEGDADRLRTSSLVRDTYLGLAAR
jgi:branched-chain amino acid transport system ATP-binding protein